MGKVQGRGQGVTVGGGMTMRGHGRGLKWPKCSRRPYVAPGLPLIELLDKRPELDDMLMPRVQELLKESV